MIFRKGEGATKVHPQIKPPQYDKHGVPITYRFEQARLRWQTEESLRTYCRLGMADYGSMLDRAAEATVAAVQTSNIPVYEQFQFFTALNSMVDSI